MTNEAIAEHFSLLSKLMDIHGDNSFKSKSYANAAFQIERLPAQLVEMNKSEWAALRGIGSNMAQKIDEVITTGTLRSLNEYIANTPEGVVQMLKIKGLGPKKINAVWKEMEIESIGELLYACNENRLVLYKGFGEKTQKNVLDAILFMMAQEGKFLYQQAEPFAALYEKKLKDIFGSHLIGETGEFRRQEDIVSQIDFLVAMPLEDIREIMKAAGLNATVTENRLTFHQENAPAISIHPCTVANAGPRLLTTTGPQVFITFIESKLGSTGAGNFTTEDEIFAAAGLQYIQPQHREAAIDQGYYQLYSARQAANVPSIKGIIHSHSQWSDGSNTLREMAEAAITKGLQYLVISDHSRAATYAGGLTDERVLQQHIEIERLNGELKPFKIFKSIECDILGNGQLDYDEDLLQRFDLVIASVHSSLKMSEEKAMQRLIAAIENPFTLILGHMTGRLLLSRNGYPVDHKKIIDACAANQVVIELNAHPRRLDIDWHWIPYALKKDVLISINPDAHSIEGFEDIRYGCIAAGKALLPASSNLSSFSLAEFEDWLYDVRAMKGTIG